MAIVKIKGIADGVGDYVLYNASITEVEVPQDFMTRGIAASIPYSYASLATIQCAPNVRRIGAGSLSGCTSLVKFVFSNGIESVDANAFNGISGLLHVVYGEGEDQSKAPLATIAPNATHVGWRDGCVHAKYGVCKGATNVTSVSFPDSLTDIGSNAFEGCTGIGSIDLSGVETVGSYAFKGCTGLESIVFSSKLKQIYVLPFSECTSISSVEIGDLENWCGVDFSSSDSNPIRFANRPTFGGTVLTAIESPHNVPTVKQFAFYSCTSLESLSLGDTTVEIGNYAFSQCSNLVTATASAVERIGQYAFYRCGALSSADSLIAHATAIGTYAFANCSSLTSIRIPGGISEIPASCFRSCSAVTSVEIEDGVTTIGDYAFAYCTGLTEVALPSSIKSMSETAFTGSGIVPTTTDDGLVTMIGGFVIEVSSEATELDFNALTVGGTGVEVTGLNAGVFAGKTALTSITLPSGATEIQSGMFNGLTSMTSVILPDTLVTIGEKAFNGCTSLLSVEIPDSVKTIGGNAFAGTTGLVSVYVSESSRLETIGEKAFSGSGIITTERDGGQTDSFFLPKTIKSIGNNAFMNCTGLVKLGIRDRSGAYKADAVLGDGVFKGCTSLTTVGFGNAVSYIGEKTFEGCSAAVFDTSSIPSLTLMGGWVFGRNGTAPSSGIEIHGGVAKGIAQRALSGWTDFAGPLSLTGVPYVGSYAFENCTSLKQAELDGLATIPDGMFYGCSSLASVSLPKSGITSIGASAFRGTAALQWIEIPETVVSIGAYAFASSGLIVLAIPDSVTELKTGCLRNCLELAILDIGAGVTRLPDYFCSGGNNIGDQPIYSTLTIVVVRGAVNVIGRDCFSGCYALREFSIPSGVEYIGDFAFFNCISLESARIPRSCKHIGSAAFAGAGNYKGAFSVSLPEGLETFGTNLSWSITGVFDSCIGLKEVFVPSTVGDAGKELFRRCTGLEKVTFAGDCPKINVTGSIFRDLPENTVDVFVQEGSSGFGETVPGTWRGQNIKFVT